MAEGYTITEILMPYIWFDPSRIENDLKTYLRGVLGKCAVIEANQDIQRPNISLQTVMYNIISISDETGHETLRERIQNDTVEITKESFPIMIVSYNCSHTSQATARQLALFTSMFFKDSGKESLETNEAVVVEISPIQNRSVWFVDTYLHQFGFDVTLRTKQVLKSTYERINNVDVSFNTETLTFLGDVE